MLEEKLLGAIEDEILTPENVAALVKKTEAALARLTRKSQYGQQEQKAREAQLRKAEQELEAIKDAIRKGILTPTTREMPEETEAKIQRLRTELTTEPRSKTAVRALPGTIERIAQEVRTTLHGGDMDQARTLLGRLLGKIVLTPEGEGLMAEVRGDLGTCLSNGAGRGISYLPKWPPTFRIVA